MNKKLRKKCEKLHKQNKFGEIIQLLEPQAQANDAELVGQLARAYNNKGRYQEALELLLSVRCQSEDDALWHFRLGYAYDHLAQPEKALQAFEKVLEINPRDWEARIYIRKCRQKIKKMASPVAEETTLSEENEIKR